MIHTSDLPDHATQIQESFGQSRLPGIYMRQDSYYQFFHVFSSFESFLFSQASSVTSSIYIGASLRTILSLTETNVATFFPDCSDMHGNSPGCRKKA